ncbi:tetratricopeptide repeat protein [bacterium]|nr:tetratricopeptide repeat protein [bacterium]MDC1221881.1 tetratricopeptide repeat protein [Salibacteraceae bacterium]
MGCILSLCLASQLCFAENEIRDSLKHQIANLPESIEQANAMGELQQNYVNGTQYDSALFWATEMERVSKAINYQQGVAIAQAHISYCHYFIGNYNLAISWTKKAKKSGEKGMDAHFLSTCIGNAGLIFHEMGEYDSAMVYLLKCLAIREKGNDTIHIAYTHYDIAELHKDLGEFDLAVEHHEKVLELRKMIPNLVDDYNVIEDSYRALGMAYHRDGNQDKAKDLIRKSLEISQDKADVKRQANAYRELGVIDVSEKKYNEALNHFFESRRLDNSINNLQNDAELSELIGETYLMLGSYDKSEMWYKTSLQRANEMQLGPIQVKAHEALAEVYSKQSKHAAAFKELKLAQIKKDSMLNEQKIRAINELNIR